MGKQKRLEIVRIVSTGSNYFLAVARNLSDS